MNHLLRHPYRGHHATPVGEAAHSGQSYLVDTYTELKREIAELRLAITGQQPEWLPEHSMRALMPPGFRSRKILRELATLKLIRPGKKPGTNSLLYNRDETLAAANRVILGLESLQRPLPRWSKKRGGADEMDPAA